MSLASRTAGVHWFVPPDLVVVDRSDLVAPVGFQWQEIVLPMTYPRRGIPFVYSVD